MKRLMSLVSVVACMLPALLSARVLSYAPVTNRHAVPAIQERAARYYVLAEFRDAEFPQCQITCPVMPTYGVGGQVVVYDSRGEKRPQVVFPPDGGEASISMAATWGTGEDFRLLVASDTNHDAQNAQRRTRLFYSPTAGKTWREIPVPAGRTIMTNRFASDNGGPIVLGRGSDIRLGDDSHPFVYRLAANDGTSEIIALAKDGSTRTLTRLAYSTARMILGSNAERTRFLVVGRLPEAAASEVSVVGFDTPLSALSVASVPQGELVEGWIAPRGAAYLLSTFGDVWVSERSTTQRLATTAVSPSQRAGDLFAVPTHDYDGAWIVQRPGTGPTTLTLHDATGLKLQWEDITRPEIEAIHAARSGERLLVQVHRPRVDPNPQVLFIDPALAIWKIGDPAPKSYDELFLNEGMSKTFVNLDVDGVAKGASFVFDSAATVSLPPPPISSAPAGADVLQEWGVVRSSLIQRLVIPAFGRTAGAYGSLWRTDLIIRNPEKVPVTIDLRYVPNGYEPIPQLATMSLDAGEIRVVTDALVPLFGATEGSGALFLQARDGYAIHATSRTYTTAEKGTYGMGVGAIDLHAAAGERFALTFAGAIHGENYRTNITVTDAGVRGVFASVRASGLSGAIGREATVAAPPGGQLQFLNLADLLGVRFFETAAVGLEPLHGDAITTVSVVDNRTNDPTFFPPDLSSGWTRTIPVIGHVDGAHGSRYRSDLFLYNTNPAARTVRLAVKRWDVDEGEKILDLTLMPDEARVLRDVLQSAFGMTGVARLRYTALSPSGVPEPYGIRVTSRTYNVDDNGGTYGLLVPPLNSFQSVGPGEALELIVPAGDPKFRVNLALVDLSATGGAAENRVRIEIYDDRAMKIDSFEIGLGRARGMQIDSIFQARSLGDGPRAAMFRVSTSGGLVAAYASVTDNGTNDPTYFAANLAATE